MALKAMIETKEAVDALDESLRGLYVEQDGKFVLGVESVGGFALENVEALKTALSSERTTASTAQAQLKAFEGLDAAAARKALGDIEEFRKANPEEKHAKLLEAEKKTLNDKWSGDYEKLKGELGTTRTHLERLILDGEVAKAIGDAKGNVLLLTPHIRAQLELKPSDNGSAPTIIVKGNDGNARLTKGAGTANMTVAELVADFKKDKNFATAFEGTDATGTAGRKQTETKDSGQKAVGPNLSQADAMNKLAATL